MKHHPTHGAHERARRLRSTPTEAEKRVWRMLRSEPLATTRFRRQVPIGPFIADFASHGAKLVVEVDGGQHDPASEAEAGRTAFMEAAGYRVLRFWNHEVLGNPEGVFEVIAAVRAPVEPSPSRGEGRVGVIPPPAQARHDSGGDITPTQPSPLEARPWSSSRSCA